MHSISNIYHYYIVDLNREIHVSEYVGMYYFSFVAIESEMVDYKNHIGHDDIINKRGQGELHITFFKGIKP